MNTTTDDTVEKSLMQQVLGRILRILPVTQSIDWQVSNAAVWQRGRWQSDFVSFPETQTQVLDDLLHIDAQKESLQLNTAQFVAGLPANNALLWGARGAGKSSLIHGLLHEYSDQGLRLVELRKDELQELSEIVARLSAEPYRFIVFCDDLSFEEDDASYKILKSALEGSVFKGAANVIFYATSNRRHLLPERASDNSKSGLVNGELHHGEAVEEKISLSDRFGLWLSFYPFRQEAYLDMVEVWVSRLVEESDPSQSSNDTFQREGFRQEALRWALARGVRSGRTASHFARHWVGQKLLETSSLDK
ncbi:MAG: ATP-binding protein [Pseudomonadales bacterium]|nr:ATP-binding protein [Pseudomonadales bacterium]